MAANITLAPFNFYQGTGSDTRPVWPGTTLFTGSYFTKELILGYSHGYIWRLTADDILFPPVFDTYTSGHVVSGNNLKVFFNNNITGTFFGYPKDPSDFSVSMDGVVTGDKIMTGVFVASITGYVSGDSKDPTTFTATWGGVIGNEWLDLPEFSLSTQGDLISGYLMENDFTTSFVGIFVPKDSDTTTLSFSFDSITFEAGAERFNIDEQDTKTMTFSLSSIDWKTFDES